MYREQTKLYTQLLVQRRADRQTNQHADIHTFYTIFISVFLLLPFLRLAKLGMCYLKFIQKQIIISLS